MASTHSPTVKLPVVIIQDASSTDNDIHQKKKAKTSPNTPPRILHPNSNKLLDNMLYPLTRDDFLKHHFRKDAVHISRNQSSHASELVSDISNNYLFGLDVHEIFTETSSENVFLWLRPPSSNTATLNSVEISDPDTAYALHMSGRHSAYCRAPPILEKHLVSSLLQATGLGGGHYHAPHSQTVTLGGNTTLGRGEVELFIGADGGDNNKRDDIQQHTTGWHTDFQENFTIQISGVKRWTLRRGRVTHPLRATTPHYARDASVVENQLKVARLSCLGGHATNDTTYENSYGFEYNDNNAVGEEQVVTLYPGDCFYFPSGMWHTVETIEPGISLNVSLMGTTYAQLVSESLQHLLSQHEEWREVVTSRPGDNEETGSSHLQGLLSGLSQLVDDFVNKQGGAQSIMPPALCHPPLDREGEDNEAEDTSSNEESECKEENQSSSSGDEKDETMNDQKMDHMSDNDEDEEDDSPVSGMIISIDKFEGPIGWSSSQPTNAKLIKNPLACLIAISDIDSDDKQQQKGIKQYVLNVNYCGNDMMESHIRVILEATSTNLIEQMDWYLECEAKRLDVGQLFNNSNGNASISSRYLPPPPVLFYFGYFSWTS